GYGGGTPPPGSTPVTVPPGVAVTINASLVAGGVMAGTVVDDVTSAGVANASGTVWLNGNVIASGQTRPDGTYRILGLAAAAYTVCFDSFGSIEAGFGYVPECHDDVPMVVSAQSGSYVTSFEPAPGTTPVPVAAAATSTVNARLAGAGGMIGRVIASD